jgi:hypothetical protein
MSEGNDRKKMLANGLSSKEIDEKIFQHHSYRTAEV